MLYSILLEITPRPCRINYQDSFHPHLPRANLPRKAVYARDPSLASTPRERSTTYAAFGKRLIAPPLPPLRQNFAQSWNKRRGSGDARGTLGYFGIWND